MTISGFIAYIKQAWKNKPDTSTPLSADRLVHVEDGIKGNSNAIESIAAAVVSQIVNDPNKVASMAALYEVNRTVTQLNSDFATAKYSTDLFLDCAKPTFLRWDSGTNNTPNKAGLTTAGEGFAIAFGSWAGWLNVIAWCKDLPNMYSYTVSNGQVTGWKEYALKDDYYKTSSNVTINLNSLEAGYCYCDSASQNLPAAEYGFCLTYYRDASTRMQMYITNTNRMYTRTRTSGAWSAWAEK